MQWYSRPCPVEVYCYFSCVVYGRVVGGQEVSLYYTVGGGRSNNVKRVGSAIYRAADNIILQNDFVR